MDRGFNPSYGLHALRARMDAVWDCWSLVSIPHMGCMPYGHRTTRLKQRRYMVSIPHMGCMPYGQKKVGYDYCTHRSFNPSYGLHALRADGEVCLTRIVWCFNPSYGLHALRAELPVGSCTS